MSMSREFKQLERKAYLSYHQDGIIDLLVAWMVFTFGMNLLTDESFWVIMGWFPITFFVPLKNRITVPRFGYVKFSTTRGGINMLMLGFVMLTVLILLVLGTFVFVLSDGAPPPFVSWIRQHSLLFWAALVGLLFGMAGVFSGIRRFLLYGLLGFGLMTGGYLLSVGEYLPFMVLAGAIVICGAILMIRFMRQYPLPPEEPHNATG